MNVPFDNRETAAQGCGEGQREVPAANPKAAPLPAYVAEALRGLTPAQRWFVVEGCIHGDIKMRTLTELERKALFYFHPTSPNGRCGEFRLTPLGVTVQRILKERAGRQQKGTDPMSKRTFEQWLAELSALAAAEGCPNYVQQTGEECWRESFADGFTPAEAWADEKSYAAEDHDASSGGRSC